jgi:hypothetical protein
MRLGHLKPGKTASSATSLRAAAAAVVVAIRTRVAAAAVIFAEIAKIQI